jgi:cell division protein FtsW
LLILVLVPGIGKVINGASRWIGFMGFTFQPAELAKLTLVIYLAYSLTKKDAKIRTLTVGFIPHIILLAIIATLIMLERDFGATVTVGILVFIMMFVAGVRFSYIVLTAAAAVPVILLGLVSVPYRWERIMAFKNPWADPLGKGYHIIQSYLAFGSGGIVGTGLGGGTQKLFYIPYAYSDFIFAVIGEELGFFGVVLLVGAFAMFAVRGFRAARLAPDLFGTYLAMGITSLITLGAIMNICVVTGLLPTKGMTLPLVSYGGSSLLVSMTAVGILLNVSGKRQKNITLDNKKVGIR